MATISELESANSVSLTDLYETSVLENNKYKSRKQPLSAILNAFFNKFTFNSLNTESKTVINAINEAYENGGGTEIDDTTISPDTTWSSLKISNYVIQNRDEFIQTVASYGNDNEIQTRVTVTEVTE